MSEVRVDKQEKTEPNDGDLLKWIGRGNHDAFAKLYRRHHLSAFNLALFLCRDRERAEEAVQNAMIDVWKSAAQCRAENPKAWILRIVARHSVKLTRKSKTIQNREQRGEETQWADAKPKQAAEDLEVNSVLRSALGKLPDEDRRIVALYYAGGASQDEIAREMALSQKGISKRIARILENLRRSLVQAGCAVHTGAMIAEQIAPTICSDAYPNSSGLMERMFARIGEGIQDEGRRNVSPVAPSPFTAALSFGVPLAVLLVASIAGLTYYAPKSVPEKETVTEEPTFNAQWTFENGPSKDLEVVGGEWLWWPAYEQQKAVMAVPPAGFIVLRLPPILPNQPVEVKVTTQGPIHHPNTPKMVVQCSHESGTFPYRAWIGHSEVAPGARYVFRTLLFKNRMVKESNGTPWEVTEYTKPLAGHRIALIMKNFRIEKIEIRKLSEQDVPPQYRRKPARILKEFSGPKDGLGLSFKALKHETPALRSRRWTFDKGMPKEFESVAGGKIHWESAKETRSAAIVFPNKGGLCAIRMPVDLSIRPFVVTVKIDADRPGKTDTRISWGNDLGEQATVKGKGLEFPVLKNRDQGQLTFYCNRRYIIFELSGRPFCVARYKLPFSSNNLNLILSNARVEFIEFKEVPLTDFPAAYRDPAALWGEPAETIQQPNMERDD